MLVEIEGDGAEADLEEVLEDRVGRAADVGGDADLLGFEVVHQLLVIRSDELAVVVG